ncbi:MAG: hypothetical protein IID48_15240 [Proteobacteria bacterium]|nr:hypothetical protein [Pseudomonadota bacterium]
MNVIIGVLLATLIVGSALIHLWPAIQALSGGAAAFLGALVGAAAGLGAILGGALYNAKLNRDEYERRRRDESRTIAIAFRAELLTVMSDAAVRLKFFAGRTKAPMPVVEIAAFDVPRKVVYDNNTHRLGDLGEKVAELVVYAHGNVDHIRQTIAAILAYPSDTMVPPIYMDEVRRAFFQLAENAAKAHNALDVFLGDPERYPDLTNLAAEAAPGGASAKSAKPDLEKPSE